MNQDQILLEFKQGKYSAEDVIALLRQARVIETPLSENQHGLWLLQELEPLSTAYNVPFCVKLSTGLDVRQFKAACEMLCDRHPVLSSVVAVRNGAPVQLFRQKQDRQGIIFHHQDVFGLDEQQLLALLKEEAAVPFRLAEGPLVRFAVFTAGPTQHTLLFVAHHIIFDGVSTAIFLTELFQIYESLVQHRPHKLKSLQASYGDFVAWEKQFLKSREGEASLRYWREQLSSPLPNLTLPFERSGQQAIAKGKSYSRKLNAALTARLRNFSRLPGMDHGINVSVLFLGVYQLLLQRYTGESDIVVGMPVLGRPESKFENVLGYFVNMMAVRSRIDEKQVTRKFFAELGLRLIDGLEHSAYPFPRLVGELGISSAQERYPVFQVAFAFQNSNIARTASDGNLLGHLEIVEEVHQQGEYKLSLEVLETLDGFTLNFKFDANKFAEPQIAAMFDHYVLLLEGVLHHPERMLHEHSILSESEYRHLVFQWNDTATAYPTEKCLHDLFAEQVARTPDAIAATYNGEQLTYAQLHKKTNQLAHYLINRGVKSDVVVGIAVERSLEMIVGLMGILKAGGAYAPLDPHYPQDRLSYMLEDCGTPVLLTQQALVGSLPSFKGEVICLDSGWASIAQESEQAADVSVAPHHLAYVIYTSGSTGKPKGVMNQHDGVVNRLIWMQEKYGLTAADVVLQKTSFSFDVSVWEFFWPLITGASIVFAKPEGHKDNLYLIDLIKRERVSTLHFVPSMLSVMLGTPQFAECVEIKRVFCSGEALSVEHVRQFSQLLPRTELHNLYGPTEAAIDVSYWPCEYQPELRTVPIGKPVANTQLYVLDEHLQPVPVGVSGELYIGGVQLARGYLNKPELTTKAFIPNPLPGTPGDRLYKTGDVARYLADGNIEYLGRRDHQVKIRGFRIELGEIESLLLSHSNVQSCVVLAREDVPGEKRLVAYYAVREGRSVEAQELRTLLGGSLPDYMVPSAFVALEVLPLTPNGKVDRKALPAPDGNSSSVKSHEAPRGQIEEKLGGIWQTLLHADRVGRHDGFFELGGHSLLATSAISQVRQVFAVDLPLRELFEHPTLSAFARVIASALGQEATQEVPLIAMERGTQDLPLSYAQQRLWFLAQLEQSSANYNMPLALRLKGKLNQSALLKSIETIVDRHEVLRTRFVEAATGVAQQIAPPGQFRMAMERHSADPEAIVRLCAEEAGREFDLSRDSLIRARLLQIAADEHVLLVTLHHSVTDGWSMTVFFRELVALYDAFEAGAASPLPPLKIQYADFAYWQRQWLSGDVLAAQQSYWQQQLAGIDPVLALPTDRPRPAVKTYAGAVERFSFSKFLQAQLNQLSQAQGATLYMTLLAAFNVLLSRYSHQTDIAVGTPIANRSRAELESLIGFFVNTLVMRTDLSGTPSFVEVLQRVKRMALAAYAHQDVPFEQLVELLQPQRSLSYTPFFQVMFGLQNLPSFAVDAADMTISPIEQQTRAAKFDLTVLMVEADGCLQGEVEYNTDLFDAATIRRMIGHYETLLTAIVTAPAEKISQYDVLSAPERHQLLVEWNDTATAYPAQKCLHEVFVEQVARTPNAVAVVYEDELLTYGELNRKANQLARYLKEQGVKVKGCIPLVMPRSAQMLIAQLAVLKVGCAYVPIDPEFPEERQAFMIQDCGAKVVIAFRSPVFNSVKASVHWIDLEASAAAIEGSANHDPVNENTSEDAAYVMYTSGSTGVPKGVVVPHRAVNRLVINNGYARITPADCLAHCSNPAFDASTFEVWGALLNGARVLIVSRSVVLEPAVFAGELLKHGVTVLWLTVGLFNQYVDALASVYRQLRYLLVGGDALDPRTIARLLRHSPPQYLLNGYGPTECTTFAATYRIESLTDETRSLPIGRPISNTQIYLLDAHRQPVPIGVVGEIYIGGAGVALGYLNRPELTAERFITDPFKADPTSRLYMTGDLGRYRADGNIEYVGRNDQQVKIRGFRIELGEIESLLMTHAGLQSCVVLAREDVPGQKRLVAYYTTRDGQVVDVEALRTQLSRDLPEYMVPSAYVMLDALPLTPNGKVDRKALPAPDETAYAVREYEAPEGKTEEALAKIWQELLHIERVGRNDNFFELGGHSLLATSVISQVRKTFEVDLPLRTLFEHPTVAAFAEVIASQEAAPTELPLTVIDRSMQDLPLSYAQQRLWFLAQLEQSSANYNVPLALRLKGKLNQPALLRSIEAIVDRHEVLRTRFVEAATGVTQRITPPGQFQLKVETHTAGPDALAQLCAEEAGREFDLSRDSLIRARLLRIAADEHVLLVTLHHSVTDGWSMSVFFRELVALYDAYEAGAASPLPPLKIQYADFAHWQRQWLSGGVLAAQQAYWQQQLAGVDPVLALPTDRPRPAIKTYNGAVERFHFSKSLQAQLNQLSQAQGATLYMTLLAAFNVLLSRYSDQTDIAVGTPIANRSRAELESLIGFFVNTLVMRTDLSGAPSFVELLQRVKRMALAAYAHQDVPFEQLVELLQPQRSLSYTPFFQVMFALQNLPSFAVDSADMIISPIDHDKRAAKFDLNVALYESDNGLQGEVEYNTDLFDPATVRRLIGHYEQLLTAIAAAPAEKISTYDLLRASERHQILIDWNSTAANYPTDKFLHELFAEQVERTPNAIALEHEGRTLSYRELNAKANQLAHYLRKAGVGPDELVALCVERSIEMVVGILGVLKAGGAYVPLDAGYPQERLEYMVKESSARVILIQEKNRAVLPDAGSRIISLDGQWEEISQGSQENIGQAELGLTSEHLLYVIYTSGSTGRPKGTSVCQGGVRNLLQWYTHEFDFSASDRTLVVSSFSFDLTQKNFFAVLLTGGQLHLAKEPFDPAEIARQIHSESITTINLTPSAFYSIVESDASLSTGSSLLSTLRCVFLGGEPINVARIRSLADSCPRLTVINSYGPTECSDVSSFHVLEKDWATDADASIPIGRPVSNTLIYILDSRQAPVPIGVVGEIYIGGVGVARGYLNRPEMTAERFLKDPFSSNAHARMYKTGDLARWRPDGNIEYLGRNDHQVKIRGFRIELGEIESLLMTHAGVQSCVVIGREDVPGEKRLVAYYTVHEGQAVEVDTLRTLLRNGLPEYMVPSAYVVLETLPLTPNGKVDRKALPVPGANGLSVKHYEAPQGQVEEKLAGIWQALLHVEKVGRHDNFFELGGHSLLATSAISQVRQAFAVDLPLRTMFEYSTLSGFASLIVNALDQEATIAEAVPLAVVDRSSQDLPLSYAQQRLWFLAQLEQSSANYNVPLALRLKGKLNPSALRRSIEAIIDRHEVLRTHFVETAAGVAQYIAQQGQFEVALELHRTDPDAIARICAAEASKEFDLSRDNLIRVRVLQLGPEEHVLLVTMHHTVTDGWSMTVFFHELVALYDAYETGAAAPLPPLKIQYADFAHWQRQWLSGEVLSAQQAYWRQQLAGVDPVLPLPTDRPRPAVKTYAGAVERFCFSKSLQAQLNQLSQAQGATLYMTLLAAFKVLLSRYSHQTDIAVGSPVSNRPRAELEALIGFFVNTLVMRTDLSGAPTFVEALQRVKRMALDAYAHQDVPFEQLVELLQPQRSLSYTPFFQVAFALLNLPGFTVSTADMEISSIEQESRAAKFDLTLSVYESESGLQGEVEYNTDLFDASTIRRLIGHYERLLAGIVAAPTENIGRYDLLSGVERQLLLANFNDTACAYPKDKCLHGLFAEQVARTPNAIAATYNGEQLTYAQLDKKTNQLAHYLIKRGVKSDVVVGIAVERSLEMIIGLMGILKAGGAYAPLDPHYPQDRLSYMLEDCGTPVLLTQQALVDALPSFRGEVICLDSGWESIAQESDRAPSVAVAPHHLAYVIYTSGSTGKPKGVMNQHDGVVNRLIWMQEKYGLTAADVVLQKTSFSFDVSVWEFFWPLITGASIVFAKPEGHKDNLYLIDLIKRERVSTLHFVPSMLSVMLGTPQFAECVGIKRVFCSGEALSVEHVRQFSQLLPRTELHNLYGPTEAAIDVSYWPCEYQPELRTVPIGKPVANTQLYVLDEHLQPVPVGVSGELYIGGVQLARGYLNKPELTTKAFIPNPLPGTPADRLYKTGDVARYLADGNIEYLGRQDHQIKLRGFRIELGEIETALMEGGEFQSCVVIARDIDREGAAGQPGQKSIQQEKQLVAYCALNEIAQPAAYRLSETTPEGLTAPQLQTLPNGLEVYSNKKSETEFLYHEIFEQRFYYKHGISIHPGACIFDVGANVGMFSVFLATHFDSPVIYAFEPIPNTFSILNANSRIYGANTIVPMCLGLSDSVRKTQFNYFPQNSILSGKASDDADVAATLRSYIVNTQLSKEEAGGTPDNDQALLNQLIDAALVKETVDVALSTVSAQIKQHGLEVIDLLKIDVERSELEVLQGIEPQDWPKIRQLIIEVHDTDNALSKVGDLLNSHGFALTIESDSEMANTNLYSVFAIRDPQSTVSPLPALNTSRWGGVAHLKQQTLARLRACQPDYMVPAHLIFMQQLPLTPNGKLDRKALPAPGGIAHRHRVYRAPVTTTEKSIAALWEGLLAVEKVGRDDSFFALGGHSLLAMQFMAKLQAEFGLQVQLRTLFECPTVELFAASVDMLLTARNQLSVRAEDGDETRQVGAL